MPSFSIHVLTAPGHTTQVSKIRAPSRFWTFRGVFETFSGALRVFRTLLTRRLFSRLSATRSAASGAGRRPRSASRRSARGERPRGGVALRPVVGGDQLVRRDDLGRCQRQLEDRAAARPAHARVDPLRVQVAVDRVRRAVALGAVAVDRARRSGAMAPYVPTGRKRGRPRDPNKQRPRKPGPPPAALRVRARRRRRRRRATRRRR